MSRYSDAPPIPDPFNALPIVRGSVLLESIYFVANFKSDNINEGMVVDGGFRNCG